jgi:hypothetical protein
MWLFNAKARRRREKKTRIARVHAKLVVEKSNLGWTNSADETILDEAQ